MSLYAVMAVVVNSVATLIRKSASMYGSLAEYLPCVPLVDNGPGGGIITACMPASYGTWKCAFCAHQQLEWKAAGMKFALSWTFGTDVTNWGLLISVSELKKKVLHFQDCCFRGCGTLKFIGWVPMFSRNVLFVKGKG